LCLGGEATQILCQRQQIRGFYQNHWKIPMNELAKPGGSFRKVDCGKE
jgi:hypothetical protein